MADTVWHWLKAQFVKIQFNKTAENMALFGSLYVTYYYGYSH